MDYFVLDITRPINFVDAGKCDLPDNFMHYKRNAEYFILYLLIDGEFYLNCDGEDRVFKAGDVFLMPPNTLHYGYKEHAVKLYWLHFTADSFETFNHKQANEFLKENHQNKILIPNFFPMNKIENYMVLINQTIGFSKKHKTTISQYLSTALLIEIANQFKEQLDETKTQKSTQNRRFQEIASFIGANYKENLKTKDIAEKFGYNEKYLGRLFKKHFNMTVKEYIIDSRLRISEFLLLSSTDTVATIAYNCGFVNEFYFMKLFKKKYGLTPTNYRNTFHSQNYTRYKNE